MFSQEPGLHEGLAATGIPTLMCAGTADPWHEPMREFAERTPATRFFSVADADHKACWDRADDVLPAVLEFLSTAR